MDPVQSFFCIFKGFFAEIWWTAIMGLCKEKSYNLWVPGLQKILYVNNIPQRFRHFLSVDSKKAYVHPIVNKFFSSSCFSLGNFIFMMWKTKIHSSTMDIKRQPQVFCTHRRALYMPSWSSLSPRRIP